MTSTFDRLAIVVKDQRDMYQCIKDKLKAPTGAYD